MGTYGDAGGYGDGGELYGGDGSGSGDIDTNRMGDDGSGAIRKPPRPSSR